MSNLTGMEIGSLRKELNLSLEGFAELLGLRSKGHAHDIESGVTRPSVRVALEIERLSDGRIDAAGLNPDVALVRQSGAAADAA